MSSGRARAQARQGVEDHRVISVPAFYSPTSTRSTSPLRSRAFASYEEFPAGELQEYLAENARREVRDPSPPKVLMETDEDLEVGESESRRGWRQGSEPQPCQTKPPAPDIAPGATMVYKPKQTRHSGGLRRSSGSAGDATLSWTVKQARNREAASRDWPLEGRRYPGRGPQRCHAVTQRFEQEGGAYCGRTSIRRTAPRSTARGSSAPSCAPRHDHPVGSTELVFRRESGG